MAAGGELNFLGYGTPGQLGVDLDLAGLNGRYQAVDGALPLFLRALAEFRQIGRLCNVNRARRLAGGVGRENARHNLIADADVLGRSRRGFLHVGFAGRNHGDGGPFIELHGGRAVALIGLYSEHVPGGVDFLDRTDDAYIRRLGGQEPGHNEGKTN